MKKIGIKTKTDIAILVISIIWLCFAIYVIKTKQSEVPITGTFIENYHDYPAVKDWSIYEVIVIIYSWMLLASSILFFLRKKIGWIFLAVGITWTSISLVKFGINWYENINEKIQYIATLENSKDIVDEYPARVTRAMFELSFVIVLFCGLLWFICRKTIRNIYSINPRTIIWTISLTLLSWLLFEALYYMPADKVVQIRQTETNEPVILRSDTAYTRLYRICFPLSYEFTNSSLQKRKIDRVRYFHCQDSHDSFVLEYIKKDGELVLWGGRDSRNAIQIFQSGEHLVYTSHRLDTTSAVQNYFKPYLEEMRTLQTAEFRLGTMAEFVRDNPEMAKKLLEGDSISFEVRSISKSKRQETLAIIDMPVNY